MRQTHFRLNEGRSVPQLTEADIRRFTVKIAAAEAGRKGCWLWLAAKDKNGYGQFRLAGQTYWAHRVAYSLWVEPLKPGMTVGHVGCNNSSCVRPDHLEQQTEGDNARDANIRRYAPAPETETRTCGRCGGPAVLRWRGWRCLHCNHLYTQKTLQPLEPAPF